MNKELIGKDQAHTIGHVSVFRVVKEKLSIWRHKLIGEIMCIALQG